MPGFSLIGQFKTQPLERNWLPLERLRQSVLIASIHLRLHQRVLLQECPRSHKRPLWPTSRNLPCNYGMEFHKCKDDGRRISSELNALIDSIPAVALIGPRQVGKTTLALAIGEHRPSIYLDLESDADRAKLAEPELYLAEHSDKLVILDEVHRLPNLFQNLRGLIDRGRRAGKKTGRFLLLGSASMELLRQSGETLAGRIAYLEMHPIDGTEVPADQMNMLWVRGGFPDSFLASSDRVSQRWRQDFIRTYLERDIPLFGPRIPAETLRRFWTMLAHHQSGLLNAADFARALGVDGKTVASYLDLLVDLLLVRKLEPWHSNLGKRLVKSSRISVRDSGIAHTLLGLATQEQVLGHPVAGASGKGL